jgi:hypothetical protein
VSGVFAQPAKRPLVCCVPAGRPSRPSPAATHWWRLVGSFGSGATGSTCSAVTNLSS